MNRKNFIKSCAFACLGGPAFLMLLQGCATVHSVDAVIENDKLIFRKSEFLQPQTQIYRAYVVARHNKLQHPVCVYRFSDTEFVALYMECTHKGCEVNPNEQSLVCPCHGSEFSNRGKVLNPPAEIDLKEFKITMDSENLYIHLK